MITEKLFINEVKKSIFKVIDKKSFLCNSEVYNLEKEVEKFLNIKYAVGMNTCTDALMIGIKIFDFKEKDEIICPAFTFFSTAGSIVWAGNKPVLVDIDPLTFNINVEKVKKAVTKKTKAIIPVHLYGQLADIHEIKKISKNNNLIIIEDMAQSFGAKLINREKFLFGEIGCLSFYPGKIMGAMGDGGMLLTNDKNISDQARLLRNFGAYTEKDMYIDHKIVGRSCFLQEIQAAALRVKLKYIALFLKHRQKIANLYSELLDGVGDLRLPFSSQKNVHVFNYYVIRTSYRDGLRQFLNKKGINTFVFYPQPLHLMKAFKNFGYKKNDFPEAEKAAKETLALPINEFLELHRIKEISNHIKNFFKKGKHSYDYEKENNKK
ncbi:MAG: DegT/DnrJ/EryC1/StrS family aminotransferase [Candidatus Gastranaerophilaceae bacterium]|jgi:dTDP-4-amino-4,6-dideoxygalactose transaminase